MEVIFMSQVCPECGNSDPDEIIAWGSGYQCLECGCEFGKNPFVKRMFFKQMKFVFKE